MLITCVKSGMVFKSQGFGNISTNGLHPIFTLEQQRLLEIYKRDWEQGKFKDTPSDSILLFLALMNSLGPLVIWRCPAKPSLSTVYKNLPRLVSFIHWYNGSKVTSNEMTKVVISAVTYELENTVHWIDLWENNKEDINERRNASRRNQRLMAREERLERYIKSALKRPNNYLKMLSEYAMDAANVPEQWRELWTELMCIRADNWDAILNMPMVDLQDCASFMTQELGQQGTLYSNAILVHLRDLIYRKVNWSKLYLGEDSKQELEDLISRQESMHIVSSEDDDIINHNSSVIAQNAPAQKPVRSDYPSEVAYLRADATWKVAMRQQEQRAEMMNKHTELRKKQDEIAELYAEEIDSEDDPSQLGLDLDDGFRIIEDGEV